MGQLSNSIAMIQKTLGHNHCIIYCILVLHPASSAMSKGIIGMTLGSKDMSQKSELKHPLNKPCVRAFLRSYVASSVPLKIMRAKCSKASLRVS